MNILQSETMNKESGGMSPEIFFEEVNDYLNAFEVGNEPPFFMKGFQTNEAVLRCLTPAEIFLYQVAIGVRRGIRFDYRDDPDADPMFADRIVRSAEAIIKIGVQNEEWAL